MYTVGVLYVASEAVNGWQTALVLPAVDIDPMAGETVGPSDSYRVFRWSEDDVR